MHRAGAVFRHPERLFVREIRIHLRGRLRARRQLEDSLHAVNFRLKECVGDLICRCEIARAALHGGQTDTDGKPSLLAVRQETAVLVDRAALHRRPNQDVFLHDRVGKALRHDDGCLA